VLDFIERHKPDMVVLSGDLTQRAKPEQFQQARAFVDSIPVPTLVVPGNHDVPLYRVWERVFDPFGAYRKHYSLELEPVYRDDEMLVVGINTAFGWTIKDGRIKLSRLLEVAEILEKAPAGIFKVVVAHHHIIPPPNFGSQRVLANAYEAMDLFSSAGVDLTYDEADIKAGKKVTCPLHVLWATDGAMGRMYDVLGIWKDYGTKVTGAGLTGGHNLQEANPSGVLGQLQPFLAG